MDRRIVDFHQDPDREWVAELECGHSQHVRHDPPWQLRPWVLTAETRRQRLGTALCCRLCDDLSNSEPPCSDRPGTSQYLDARMQGLCHEGAAEIQAQVIGRGLLAQG